MAASAPDDGTVIIKKYANRRLYNTESSSYITLEHLAEMVRQKRDFKVVDAKSGEDITHNVLTQIIMEEEARGQGMTLGANAYILKPLSARELVETASRLLEAKAGTSAPARA